MVKEMEMLESNKKKKKKLCKRNNIIIQNINLNEKNIKMNLLN